MSEQNFNNVGLGGFVNVDDILVVTHPNPDYPKDNLPTGTRLRCVGFSQYYDYIDYGWCRPEQPRGKYLRYGTPLFELVEKTDENRGQYFTYSLHHLKFEDESINKHQDRRNTHEWRMSDHGVRVGDLPETDLVVGDLVCFVDQDRMQSSPGYTFTHGEISSICYNRNFDDKTIRYNVDLHYTDREGKPVTGGSYPFMRASDLVLMRRGNFFKFEQGLEVEFKDLKEEVSFYTRLGRSEQLRNPATSNYRWTLEEALVSIANGHGAVLRMEGGMFGSAPFPCVYDFPTMPELVERLRTQMAEGFADEYAKIKAGESLA